MSDEEAKALELSRSIMIEFDESEFYVISDGSRYQIKNQGRFAGSIQEKILGVLVEYIMPNFQKIDDNFEQVKSNLIDNFNRIGEVGAKLDDKISDVGEDVKHNKEKLENLGSSIGENSKMLTDILARIDNLSPPKNTK